MFEKFIKTFWLIIFIALLLVLVTRLMDKNVAYIRKHDLPLYPNISQTVDNPQCSIVFFTSDRPDVVKDFYRREMPKYGWILQRNDSYRLTFTHQYDESLDTWVQIEDWRWETKVRVACSEVVPTNIPNPR